MTAQTILPANSVVDSGFNVANSVRLNAADNPSAAVTQGTPTNIDKYTFSVWVKRADIGAANSKIFSVTSGGTYGEEKLEFNQDDLIWRQTEASEGNTNWERVTDRKFRDPSAWYHIVVAYDSTDGTAANRAKMYINGVQETSFSGSGNPGSGADSYTNTSGRSLKFFALHGNLNDQNNGGYFSEMIYVDGQQLAPTDFGEFDSDSGIWKPIDVSGLTFGDNGFYLEFKETGTSQNASGIGADTSGNGNHVAVTNIVAGYISTDTCTNNFATLNPLIYESRDNTFAEGNLKITGGGGNDWVNHYGVSNFAVSSGKWFVEAKITTAVGSQGMLGIMGTSTALGGSLRDFGPANIDAGGRISGGGGDHQTGLTNFANGNIAGAAFDATNGTIQFYRNGSAYGNAVSSIASDTYYFVTNSYEAGAVVEFNFGSPPYAESGGNSDADGHGNFSMAVPSGYFALNTKNLAEYG
jgi:hypothetical protein